MGKFQKLILTAFVISFVGGVAASMLEYGEIAKAVGAPALVLSGWASFGHIITLDDDVPGEWSNPERSKKMWYSSILELFVKIAVFVATILIIYV
jgi:hypothetical protein